jgi:ParB/RepB/Spo0J family partition protein
MGKPGLNEDLVSIITEGNAQSISIKLLDDAAFNPNSMTPEAFDMLKEAIRRVGFLQPALVRPGKKSGFEIIDGHHRIAAARALEYSAVPCVVIEADDPTTAALRIGMNRMRGELNLSAVASQMGMLATEGWQLDDMTLTGFSGDEVADLLSSLKLNEDEVLGHGNIELEDAPLDDAPPVFLIEIHFADKTEFRKARAGLKRAAGKSKDLGKGLLRLLGE